MTTRDEVRRSVANERTDTTRGLASAQAASLPERLVAARERKGVDLYRAERDTKIRARYLAAMERGDYRELPGAVYTKGFLRNYALYLGLDPDDVLLQWRRERGDPKEPQAVLTDAPRPLAAPRQGLTFSPGLVVFALLLTAVLAFGAYLGVQLLRFAKPPTIAVSAPASAVLSVDEDTTSYVFEGTTIAGGSVTIKTADQTLRTNADSSGDWSYAVDLRRGENAFEISATDPSTGKVAETPVQRLITVPFLVVQAPTLTLDQPSDGATFENGAIPVEGRTTNAPEVVVRATWSGPVDAPAAGEPSPAPPPAPAAVTVPVDAAGAFSAPYDLTAGRWALTVAATSPEGKTTTLTRNVSVAYEGVNVVVSVKGGRAWLKVWVDGKVDERLGAAGRVYGNGKTLTFSGKDSVEVRTGNAAATYFTVNGTDLGRLSEDSNPGTWLIAPPDDPVRTDRR
jgi:cytoskeletal protein RodZ